MGKCIGTVVCKLDDHRGSFRGYVAMLVVAPEARKLGLRSMLVCRTRFGGDARDGRGRVRVRGREYEYWSVEVVRELRVYSG